MEDSSIPSISSGAVGSRFVSQSDIDLARQRRDEQWKAAYARIGQEPPAQPKEDAFDGRSLAEKLAANRAAKQEEWEERNKLGNQFRALEEDEVMFLDSIREAQFEEERKRKEQDGQELKSFREAVAARDRTALPPPPNSAASDASSKQTVPSLRQKVTTTALKRDGKKLLKGVLVKKKPKGGVPATGREVSTPETETKQSSSDVLVRKGQDQDDHPPAKRRKV